VREPSILISGYYGFGNLGDEALLDVIVGRLRSRYPGGKIDVLSADPAATTARLGVTATPRADIAAVGRAIDRADVVLSGGGGLLQNVTSLRSLLYYAGIIRRATRARKPTMIFAQSVGPLDVLGRAVVRVCCGGVAAATVRDERSRALLAPLIPDVTVERTADPVFCFDPPAEPLDLRAEGLDGPGPLAIVSVRRWQHRESTIANVAAVIDRLAEEHGVQAAFLPLGGPPDADVSTAIIRRAKSTPVLLPDVSLAQAAQIIGRAARHSVHRNSVRSESHVAPRRSRVSVAAALRAGRTRDDAGTLASRRRRLAAARRTGRALTRCDARDATARRTQLRRFG
jgi:polysaccharide pyruvyl transferase CsaB